MDNSFDREAKPFFEEEFKICKPETLREIRTSTKESKVKPIFSCVIKGILGSFAGDLWLKFPGFKQIIQIRVNTTTPTNSEYSLLKPLVPEGLLSPTHCREHDGCLGHRACWKSVCTYPVRSKWPHF